MLEDLKQQHQAAAPKERARLMLMVGASLVAGALMVVLPWLNSDEPPAPAEDAEGRRVIHLRTSNEPARVAPDTLRPLITVAVDGGRRVVHADRIHPATVEAVSSAWPTPPAQEQTRRIGLPALAQMPLDEALGRAFEVEGVVLARTAVALEGDKLLWTLVLGDPTDNEDGTRAVLVQQGLRSDAHQGAPRDPRDHLPGGPVVREGQTVLVRAFYVQPVTGNAAGIALPGTTPVLAASLWRRRILPSDRLPVATALEDIPFASVRDRYLADTEQVDTDPVVLQTVQWAQAQGPEALRAQVESGPVPLWGQDQFLTWSKEVSVEDDVGMSRPFTEGARGKVFRTSGLLGGTARHGWRLMPTNAYNVDTFEIVDLQSAHYRHRVIRSVSPFPLSAYPEVEGTVGERVWIYGVFIKNHTYRTKFGRKEQGAQGYQPLTMPLFVVLYMEPVRLTDKRYTTEIAILAAGIVLMALLFWFFVVRHGPKEAAALEARRLKIRQSGRAALARTGDVSDEIPAPPDAPPEAPPDGTAEPDAT